jgi:hypothetical protein
VVYEYVVPPEVKYTVTLVELPITCAAVSTQVPDVPVSKAVPVQPLSVPTPLKDVVTRSAGVSVPTTELPAIMPDAVWAMIGNNRHAH